MAIPTNGMKYGPHIQDVVHMASLHEEKIDVFSRHGWFSDMFGDVTWHD